jgi:predicted site-specific integrase-resolvase
VDKEIASGVKIAARNFWRCSRDRQTNRIVVAYKDCLTRFGFRILETLVEIQGRTIEVEGASRQRYTRPDC